MGYTLISGASRTAQAGIQSGAAGAAVASAGKGIVGKLVAFAGGPLGIALFGVNIGLSLLWGRVGRPKVERLPIRKHVLEGGIEEARYILGTRSVEFETVDSTSLPGGTYRDNHIRLIAPISEYACNNITKVWINDEEFEFERDAADSNLLVPIEGSQFKISEEKRVADGFPTRNMVEIRLKLKADGTEAASLLTTANTRWDIPDDRLYNGNPSLSVWNSRNPTSTTTSSKDPTYTCDSGFELGDDNLCYPEDRVLSDGTGDTPNQDYTNSPAIDFALEVKPFDDTWKMNGISYVQLDLFQPFFDAETGRGKLWDDVPNVRMLVEGIKFTYPGQLTPITSSNPAAILYWLDTVYAGIDTAKIDTASFTEAFNACNDEFTYRSGSVAPASSLGDNGDFYVQGTGTDRTLHKKVNNAWVSQGSISGDFDWLSNLSTAGVYKIPRYSCNLEIVSGDNIDDIREKVLATCAGVRYEVNGKIHYRVGKARAALDAINEEDIIDIEDCEPWIPIEARVNKFIGRLTQSEHNDYLPDSVPYTDSQAVTRDNETRPVDVTFDAITNDVQASNVMSVLLRQARNSGTWAILIGYLEDMKQMDYQPRDVIPINHAEYGLSNFLVEVQGVDVKDDGTVLAIVSEYKSTIYDPTLVLPEIAPRATRFPTQPLPPENPTGIKVTSESLIDNDGKVVSTMNLAWDFADVLRTDAQYRVKSPQGIWQGFTIDGNVSNHASTTNVIAETEYEIRVRHWSRRNIASDWTNGPDHTVEGDKVAPGAITNFRLTSLPLGLRAEWINPTDKDFASACVYISTSQGFTADATTLVATLNSDFFEAAGYNAGTTIYVKIRAKDTSGNLGVLSNELSVIPTPFAESGVNIFSGVDTPALTLGVNGDLYIQTTGVLWVKRNNTWINTGIDLTAAGSIIVPFHIEPTESIPIPQPPNEAVVGSIAFNTATGHYFERTIGVGGVLQWTYRGDLTGRAGEDGRGWLIHNTNTKPLDTFGMNGDYVVRPDGIWYIKEMGTWVEQGDLTGAAGSRWFTFEGQASPVGIVFGTENAKLGDFALSTTTHRYYELTLLTQSRSGWTLRGDLGAEVEGSKLIFFTAPLGTNPSLHITAMQANVGDEAINTTSAQFWEKTATPNSWILRGDLGQRITTLTTEDPPLVGGDRIGDIAISGVNTNNRKLYWWQIAEGDTSPSWVLQGVLRGPTITVDDSTITSGKIQGDLNWEDNGDITQIDDDGNSVIVRTTVTPPDELDEVDPVELPDLCKVHRLTTWPPPNTFGENGDAAFVGSAWGRKESGVWVRKTPALTTKTNAYYRIVRQLPRIHWNTPGYRALTPEAQRPGYIVIIPTSANAIAYSLNYDTDNWVRVVEMCTSGQTAPASPTGFRLLATNGLTYTATAATARVQWNAVTGATGYRLRLVPARASSAGVSTWDQTGTTLNIPGLARGVDYRLYIKTYIGTLESPEINLPINTDETSEFELPNRPASITATPSTTTQGSVSGTVFAGVATTTKPIRQTIVQVYKDGVAVSGKRSNHVGSSNVQFAFTGLAPGTGYSIRAYHNNAAGSGLTRSSSTFTMPTIGTTPTPPTTLAGVSFINMRVSFNANDTETVIVYWNAVSGATAYDWDLTPASSFVSGATLTGTVNAGTALSATAQLNNATADGTTVVFGIRPKNSGGMGPRVTSQIVIDISNLASDTNGTGARSVSGLNINTSATGFNFGFSGTSNTTNLIGYEYRIDRRRGSGAFMKIVPTTGDWTRRASTGTLVSVHFPANFFQGRGHVNEDVYLFRVRWVYSDGVGPESTVSFKVQQ